ncbi:hypothetical protein Tco_1365845 [Tanacetum coccineum]
MVRSLTIYASYIEQFWNTAYLKTINSEKQIYANVDGKAVVVSESSVRRDLHLNDEDGTACLTTNVIFENLALMGYAPASDKLTFYKVVLGECSEQPPKPQPIPYTAPPEVLSQVTTVAASQPPKDPKTHRRTKRGRNTKVPQSGGSPNKVGDEAINKEMLDSVERAASTASSLEAEQASGNINKTQFTATLNESFYLELSLVVVLGAKKPWGGHTLGSGEDNMEHQFELMDNVPNTPHDSPLLRVNTPGSGEGSLELNELMDLVTKLSHRVFNLEKVKIAQAKEIVSLKRRVTKLEQRQRSRILKIHPFRFVNTAGKGVSIASVPEIVSTAAPRTPPTTTTVFDDEDVTMAMALTLIKMKEEKAKEKGVVIIDVEDSSRLVRSITTLQPLLTIDPKDKERDAKIAIRLQAELDEELRVERERQEEASKVAIAKMFDEVQARMDDDYELDARMTHEEQEKYTIQERARLLAEFFKMRKKQLAAERVKAIRNKPPTKTQLRNLMMTNLKNRGGYKHKKEAQKPGKRLKRVARSYATQKSPKKPKVMKSAKDITEEEAAEYEKEKEKEEIRLSLKIIYNDDSEVDYEPLSKKFPIVNWEYQLLEKMEAKDMYVYKLTRVDGSSSYHGDTQAFLRRLDRMIFEPDEKDELWMNQLDWKLLRWKLYESCGVHTLFMDGTLMEINMLVEKKYSLIKELLEKMLNLQLEAEKENTMAFELIKFIKSLLEE